MPVMGIREMCMTMLVLYTSVGMSMWFRAIPRKVVRVLMMFVVVVCVIQRLMRMFVAVAYRQMQPYAQRHQSRRDPECRRGCCSEVGNRHGCTNERYC